MPARRGTERQPGEDLGFRNGPPDELFQCGRQFGECSWGSQLFVEPEHQFVPRQCSVERIGPVALRQLVAG